MTAASDVELFPDRNTSSTRSRIILVAAIALAALLLYLSLRKLDWREVWRAIAACRLPLLGVTLVISFGAYFLRGLRWRVLLNTQAKLPVLRVFWANTAGYLGNNVLPARAGELIRTAMVSSQSGLSKTFVLTTALAERLMDAIVLIIAGTVVLHVVPNKPDWLDRVSTPLLFVATVAGLALLLMPLFEQTARKLAAKLPFSEKLRQRLAGMIEHIADGVRSFHDPVSFLQFALLTFGIWSLDAYATVILAKAMGLQMSILVALLLIVGLAMGSALPSTPGYIGIYQFVAVTVLTPFHFTREQAIAFILIAQANGLVVTAILGSIGLLQYRRMGKPRLNS
ncbi:conserved hypothetical protein [Candidatus Koribacter versatilis Ellin345]|uniref:Uncharacterized protein n=1 Tax=Koribacter versatilis (strain Ellin345) TaxID=204669 RepID=Q1IMP9_KORVE|nr:lysylphosphatidylglycerol synthase transmembrane domain-containing protein [Candidatus Koribacter versatilis]ABF41851.1 conserved hypothetical protein [Candidatus Koribacter versatilis Ellin345]